ncbi:DUF1127 domain-containing protein [Maribius pontilimi]|uniref:DUF1127 domain-containing protein n=1 Tax=Palleronia pontilimi TaxID=1964209 RepID=A0A934II11_9RHOB|nr:DUF1127 domain-containing protein [Palleronia pontilimi]MBJ3762269.1 DUF1127 domain-containing protein [Palleronia pontilimi]
MATLTQTSPIAARPGRLNRITSDMRARFTRWQTYRRTFNELQALSGRELNDLGLSRSAIRSVALDAAYGHRD